MIWPKGRNKPGRIDPETWSQIQSVLTSSDIPIRVMGQIVGCNERTMSRWLSGAKTPGQEYLYALSLLVSLTQWPQAEHFAAAGADTDDAEKLRREVLRFAAGNLRAINPGWLGLRYEPGLGDWLRNRRKPPHRPPYEPEEPDDPDDPEDIEDRLKEEASWRRQLRHQSDYSSRFHRGRWQALDDTSPVQDAAIRNMEDSSE